jgi:hypothetical protein
MQRGERKLHLELGALSVQKLEACSVIARELQQRRLAYPRFPFENEGSAMASARPVEQVFQRRRLNRSAPEHIPPVRRTRGCHRYSAKGPPELAGGPADAKTLPWPKSIAIVWI